MADLPTTIDVRPGETALVRIVVIDHPGGTSVHGVDVEGNAVTRPFTSHGNLPWSAVLNLAVSHSNWSVGQPGIEDREPATGYPRFTFPVVWD